jgi:uncharacterized phage protein gp47/JayE
MPFERPTLSELRTQVAQDISAALPGTDPLLRFSNLGIIGAVLAGLANLHYGYLDWISEQANPFTATDEFLEAWAGLKNVLRLPATSASGVVQFSGTEGAVIPAGTELVRGDGTRFTSTAEATITAGIALVPATANADTGGLLGAFGNTALGAMMALGSAVVGVMSTGYVVTAFVGGADIETNTSLRSRMLLAYQNPANGGSASDYVTWALEVPGVTRVWVVPNGNGAGTVLLFVMFDLAEAAFGGFPQGVNGCASAEPRDTPATGDQLAVANHIFPLQPVTALVYVLGPTPHAVNFTINGISGASTSTKAAITAAIQNVFSQQGAATGSTIALGTIEAAIAAVPGTTGFIITSPVTNIVLGTGLLPVLGTVTYT